MATTPSDLIDIGLTRRPTVLVVEDEQNLLSLLREWLEEEYDVVAALSGKAVLERVKWRAPRVLLLDIMLPDMSGFEVVRALQGDEGTREIPIIAMSANHFADSTVKMITSETNVKGFLRKPFTSVELKRTLADVLAGRTPPPK